MLRHATSVTKSRPAGNGRVYDPVVGRFISPDNYIQQPSNTQSLNRYSYCLNNPLMFTDPSGEFWHLIIGAFVGGAMNWMMNGCQWNAEGLGYFAVGALAGALGAGVGAGVSSVLGGTSFSAGFVGAEGVAAASSSFATGFQVGMSGGLTSGFVNGMGNSLMQGNSMDEAIVNGFKVGIYAGISGAMVGGILGGIDASKHSRNFWTGEDQARGRSLMSFNNTDRSSTHYRTKNGYEPIDNIERKGEQWVDAYDERVHYGTGDPNTISNGAISRRDNYLLPDNSDGLNSFDYSLDKFQGRANMDISGSIPDDCTVQISFDGNVVQIYSGEIRTSITIPANVQNVRVSYIGKFSSGLISPWRTTITGYLRY